MAINKGYRINSFLQNGLLMPSMDIGRFKIIWKREGLSRSLYPLGNLQNDITSPVVGRVPKEIYLAKGLLP
jgi:hypothetical protein